MRAPTLEVAGSRQLRRGDAGICAQALVRAHAQSGDRIAIAAYLGIPGAFDRAIGSFAKTYADQDQRDFEALTGNMEPAIANLEKLLAQTASARTTGQGQTAV